MSNKIQIKSNFWNQNRVNWIKGDWKELDKTYKHIKELKKIIFKLEHRLEQNSHKYRPRPPFTIENYKTLLTDYQAIAEAHRTRLKRHSSELSQFTC